MAEDQKVQQLQLLEQNLQSIASQKQQFQSQLIEIETALAEVGKTDSAYKIIGNIMVLTKQEVLKEDLHQKKELTELRIKSFDKQETKLKEQAKRLQEEVLASLKND